MDVLNSLRWSLDGIGYGEKIKDEVIQELKNHDAIAIMGYSDDLVECIGAFEEEVGMYNGGTFGINKDSCELLADFDKNIVNAIWCGEHEKHGSCSWMFETEIPHSEFRVFEDGALFCVGIVVLLDDLEGRKKNGKKKK